MTRRHTTVGAALLALLFTGGLGLAVQANASGDQPANSPSPAHAIPGYQVVRLANANVPNFQRRIVECPAGKKAIGGGAEAQGENSILNGSFPTDNGSGWIGVGHQPGYGSVGISVYAICADA